MWYACARDGGGTIDVEELKTAFRLLGSEMSEHRMKQLFDKADADKSGECADTLVLSVQCSWSLWLSLSASLSPSLSTPHSSSVSQSQSLSLTVLVSLAHSLWLIL